MEMFLRGLDLARNEWKRHGSLVFSGSQLERFSQRYDELIAQGYESNKGTRGRLAKKEEKSTSEPSCKIQGKPSAVPV